MNVWIKIFALTNGLVILGGENPSTSSHNCLIVSPSVSNSAIFFTLTYREMWLALPNLVYTALEGL